MSKYLVKKPKDKEYKRPTHLDNIVEQTTAKTLRGGKPATSEQIVKNLL